MSSSDITQEEPRLPHENDDMPVKECTIAQINLNDVQPQPHDNSENPNECNLLNFQLPLLETVTPVASRNIQFFEQEVDQIHQDVQKDILPCISMIDSQIVSNVEIENDSGIVTKEGITTPPATNEDINYFQNMNAAADASEAHHQHHNHHQKQSLEPLPALSSHSESFMLNSMATRQMNKRVLEAMKSLKQSEDSYWRSLEGLTTQEKGELFALILRTQKVEERSPFQLRFLSQQCLQLEFFENISKNYGEQVVENCLQVLRYQEMEPGQTVFEQGDRGTRFFIILEGIVEVLVRQPAGTTTNTTTSHAAQSQQQAQSNEPKNSSQKQKKSTIFQSQATNAISQQTGGKQNLSSQQQTQQQPSIQQINRIGPGISFGEVGLMNDNAKRSATIRTLTACSFAYLEKVDFGVILGYEATHKINERYSFIKDYSFFDEFTYRELLTFSYHFNEVHFKRGEIVFDAHDSHVDDVYFVKDGTFMHQAVLFESSSPKKLAIPNFKTKKNSKCYSIYPLVHRSIFGLEYFNIDVIQQFQKDIRELNASFYPHNNFYKSNNNDNNTSQKSAMTRQEFNFHSPNGKQSHPVGTNTSAGSTAANQASNPSTVATQSTAAAVAQDHFKPFRMGRVICDSTRGVLFRVKASEIDQRLWKEESRLKFMQLQKMIFEKQAYKMKQLISSSVKECANESLLSEQAKYIKKPVEYLGKIPTFSSPTNQTSFEFEGKNSIINNNTNSNENNNNNATTINSYEPINEGATTTLANFEEAIQLDNNNISRQTGLQVQSRVSFQNNRSPEVNPYEYSQEGSPSKALVNARQLSAGTGIQIQSRLRKPSNKDNNDLASVAFPIGQVEQDVTVGSPKRSPQTQQEQQQQSSEKMIDEVESYERYESESMLFFQSQMMGSPSKQRSRLLNLKQCNPPSRTVSEELDPSQSTYIRASEEKHFRKEMLKEIKKNIHRIKVVPQSPSPTKKPAHKPLFQMSEFMSFNKSNRSLMDSPEAGIAGTTINKESNEQSSPDSRNNQLGKVLTFKSLAVSERMSSDSSKSQASSSSSSQLSSPSSSRASSHQNFKENQKISEEKINGKINKEETTKQQIDSPEKSKNKKKNKSKKSNNNNNRQNTATQNDIIKTNSVFIPQIVISEPIPDNQPNKKNIRIRSTRSQSQENARSNFSFKNNQLGTTLSESIHKDHNDSNSDSETRMRTKNVKQPHLLDVKSVTTSNSPIPSNGIDTNSEQMKSKPEIKKIFLGRLSQQLSDSSAQRAYTTEGHSNYKSGILDSSQNQRTKNMSSVSAVVPTPAKPHEQAKVIFDQVFYFCKERNQKLAREREINETKRAFANKLLMDAQNSKVQNIYDMDNINSASDMHSKKKSKKKAKKPFVNQANAIAAMMSANTIRGKSGVDASQEDEDLGTAKSLEDYKRLKFERQLRQDQEEKFEKLFSNDLLILGKLSEKSPYSAAVKRLYKQNQAQNKLIFDSTATIVKEQSGSYMQVREYFSKLNHDDRFFQDYFIQKKPFCTLEDTNSSSNNPSHSNSSVKINVKSTIGTSKSPKSSSSNHPNNSNLRMRSRRKSVQHSQQSQLSQSTRNSIQMQSRRQSQAFVIESLQPVTEQNATGTTALSGLKPGSSRFVKLPTKDNENTENADKDTSRNENDSRREKEQQSANRFITEATETITTTTIQNDEGIVKITANPIRTRPFSSPISITSITIPHTLQSPSMEKSLQQTYSSQQAASSSQQKSFHQLYGSELLQSQQSQNHYRTEPSEQSLSVMRVGTAATMTATTANSPTNTVAAALTVNGIGSDLMNMMTLSPASSYRQCSKTIGNSTPFTSVRGAAATTTTTNPTAAKSRIRVHSLTQGSEEPEINVTKVVASLNHSSLSMQNNDAGFLRKPAFLTRASRAAATSHKLKAKPAI